MRPAASYALLIAKGARDDPPRLFGNGAYHNAELPFEAAQSFCVTLGQPVPLQGLGQANPALPARLLENWRD